MQSRETVRQKRRAKDTVSCQSLPLSPEPLAAQHQDEHHEENRQIPQFLLLHEGVLSVLVNGVFRNVAQPIEWIITAPSLRGDRSEVARVQSGVIKLDGSILDLKRGLVCSQLFRAKRRVQLQLIGSF